MDNNRELLHFKMNMLQAEIEMNGMIAENKYSTNIGNGITYGHEEFMKLIDKYAIHDNQFPYYKEQ